MDDNSYVAIDFQLHGDPIDLQELYFALSETRPRLLKYGDKYFLRVSGFGDNEIEARRFANEYISQLNGAASLIIPGGYQPVNLEVRESYHIDSNGRRVLYMSGVVFTCTSHLRVDLSTYEDSLGMLRRRLRTVLSECAGGAERGKKLQDILQIMSKPSPSWGELYLAQELVWGLMVSSGTKTEFTTKIKHFKATAQSWTALGMQARHGKETQRDLSQENAMTYSEALDMIREYVRSFLEDIGNSGPI